MAGTVKVVAPFEGGFKIIDEADFDEAIHQKWTPRTPAPVAAPVAEPAAEPVAEPVATDAEPTRSTRRR